MDRRERNSKETKEKRKESEKKQRFRFKLTYENIFHIRLLILPFIIAYIMTNVLFLFATVVSGSMSPTIRTGDYVIVNRLAYIVNEPERGDIVSFSNKEINEHMIKRVIGLPGDFIQLINGDIYINGELLVEDYLKPGTEKQSVYPQSGYRGRTHGNMVKNRGLTQVIRKRGKYENLRADKIHRCG